MVGFSNSLQLRQTQSQTLALTPQLQQAIRMLQLSSLELTQEIQQALDTNPFLDIDENLENPNVQSLEQMAESEQRQGDDFDVFDNDSSIQSSDISLASEINVSEDGSVNDISDVFNMQDNHEGSLSEINHDSSQDQDITPQRTDDYSAATSSHQKAYSTDGDVFEGQTVTTLSDHLRLQLDCTPLHGCDRDIAIAIIDGIDESGYLKVSIEDILETIKQGHPDVQEEEILTVLKLIQHFDPLGVGSRSVQEFLLIQLRELDKNTPFRNLAIKIIEEFLPQLTNRDFRVLCSKLSIKENTLKEVIALITKQKPRPEISTNYTKSDFIIPDVIVVKKNDGTYDVELNPNSMPRVKINEEYKALADHARTADEAQYFKSNLQEANWFLQSIYKRNETLLKVAKSIVDRQTEFLEKGESAMVPMVLFDVADELSMSESTISRITTEKYIHTPRGTFELKYFFSSHVSTDDGDAKSSKAIRALIKELISKENPRKPLSDNKIADELQGQGINVARRTIAKYRESLGIASSSQRKRLV